MINDDNVLFNSNGKNICQKTSKNHINPYQSCIVTILLRIVRINNRLNMFLSTDAKKAEQITIENLRKRTHRIRKTPIKHELAIRIYVLVRNYCARCLHKIISRTMRRLHENSFF